LFFQQPQPQFFPGQTFAGFDPTQLAAQQGTVNAVAQAFGGGVPGLNGQGQPPALPPGPGQPRQGAGQGQNFTAQVFPSTGGGFDNQGNPIPDTPAQMAAAQAAQARFLAATSNGGAFGPGIHGTSAVFSPPPLDGSNTIGSPGSFIGGPVRPDTPGQSSPNPGSSRFRPRGQSFNQQTAPTLQPQFVKTTPTNPTINPGGGVREVGPGGVQFGPFNPSGPAPQTARDVTPGPTTPPLQFPNAQGGSPQGAVPLTQQALQFGLQTALDPQSNPFLQSTIQAAQRPTIDAFRNQISQIGSVAQQQGAFGGARQGLLEAQSAKDFGRTLADQAAGISNNAFNVGQQTFSNTLGQARNISQLPFDLLGNLAGVGDSRQLQQQRAIDEAQARFQFNQARPFSQLNRFQQFITAPGTFNTPPPVAVPKANKFLSALGGGASLVALLGGIKNLAGNSTPTGPAFGPAF